MERLAALKAAPKAIASSPFMCWPSECKEEGEENVKKAGKTKKEIRMMYWRKCENVHVILVISWPIHALATVSLLFIT